MEWYRALRKEKKLRDARRRLDELCSMVTVQLGGGSLKKGLLSASALLESKSRVNRALTPAPPGRPADPHGAPGGPESRDPSSTKKRKLSPQSGGGLPPSRACRQKHPSRRSWKLDSSSSSGGASPGSDTGGAVTPGQTPAPSPASTPTAIAFVPLAPASARFKAGPIPCAAVRPEPSHTDASPTPCSSAVSQAHAAPSASASSLSKHSHCFAPAAANRTALAEESHSGSAPPTGLAPPTDLAPPTGVTPPTYSAPPCEDRLARTRLPVETSSFKSPAPPARSRALAGRVSESKKATEPCGRFENTDTECNGAAAALQNSNPAVSSSKVARSRPAEERKETNPEPSDKAETASDSERLTAAKNAGARSRPITGQPETESRSSARRKCPLSRSAATSRPPPGLQTSRGRQGPGFRSGFLSEPGETGTPASASGASSEQRSGLAEKRSPRPMKAARSAASALPCKLSGLKSRSAVQTASSKAEEPGKKPSVRKATPRANPANENSRRTQANEASRSAGLGSPGGAFFLKDGAAARASRAVRAHGYRTSPKAKAKTQTPSPSSRCEVCPLCQCSSAGMPSAGTPASLAVPAAGRRSVTPGSAPGRTPKPKRRPPPRDWSAPAGPPLFSVSPARETPAKQPPTPRPKLTPRRESETGRRSVEATPRGDASPRPQSRAAASEHPRTAGHQGPSRHAAVSPGLSGPSPVSAQAPADSQPGRGNRAAVGTAEPQSLTSASAPPARGGVSERRGGLSLAEGSPSSAFAPPDTPAPGDDTWLSPVCRSDDTSTVRRGEPSVRKTEKPHSPKATPRKTLFGRGDHRGGQGGSAQKASRDSAGTDQSRMWEDVTPTPRTSGHKGAPHSRDRAVTNHPAAGQEDLLTGREGPASPPASPELIETLVSVMTSLLGLEPPLPGSLLWDPCRNTHTDQEGSCPARNLGFLMRLKAKRQRLQELRRRVERLTAELQEAREELERETAECHRREDRGDDVEEAQDEREIEREREGGREGGPLFRKTLNRC
ncbi:sialidase-like [Anguilla rostrata]|uniref:sialidase-like n=1 Tax=Anguilla rostrata TaxID=7938 RepID=UPI0030CD78A8